MSLDLLTAFIHISVGCSSIFLLDTLKKFILSKPAGRRLVTADISIIHATTAQVASDEKVYSLFDRPGVAWAVLQTLLSIN